MRCSFCLGTDTDLEADLMKEDQESTKVEVGVLGIVATRKRSPRNLIVRRKIQVTKSYIQCRGCFWRNIFDFYFARTCTLSIV